MSYLLTVNCAACVFFGGIALSLGLTITAWGLFAVAAYSALAAIHFMLEATKP